MTGGWLPGGLVSKLLVNNQQWSAAVRWWLRTVSAVRDGGVVLGGFLPTVLFSIQTLQVRGLGRGVLPGGSALAVLLSTAGFAA